METPFFGGFSTGLSPNLSDGACINLYPEVVETKDGKRIGGLYSTPGLKKWASVGSGPIRGLHNAWGQSKLITVSGNTVYSIDVNGAQTSLGTLTTIAGPVSILSNEDQVFVCDGVAGMVYSGGTWTNTGLLRPGVAVSQDTFGLANSVGTNQIFQSNAGDLSTWDPLSYTTADSTPSPVIGMAELFRQVWAFKTDAAEIYNDVGSSGFAFARMQGAYLQIGCIAPYSVAAAEHQILWLGQNDNGTACVYTTNGYQAIPCSYHALDYALSQYSVISDAVGFVYKQGGHEFYVLNFPTSGATWVYDTRLKLWHQRGEFVNGSYLLHDGQCHAQWLGMNLVGSSGQGATYKYDLGYATDDIANPGNNNPKRWMRRWRALQKPVSVPMRFPPLQIDMQTGQQASLSAAGALIKISGHLSGGSLPATVDYAYSVQSYFTSYSVTLLSGALPTGLSINGAGVVTGSVSAGGTYNWSIVAKDSAGNEATLSDTSYFYNPATFDTSRNTNGTLSSNNTVVTLASGLNVGTAVNSNKITGKWYAEFTTLVAGINNSAVSCEVTNYNTTNPISYNNVNPAGSTLELKGDGTYSQGAGWKTGALVWGVVGDVIGIAFDAGTRQIWARDSTGWAFGADPSKPSPFATLTTSTVGITAGIAMNNATGYQPSVRMNAGESAFAYAIPGGFLALSTP